MLEKYKDLPEILDVDDIKNFLNIGLRQAYELVNSGEFHVVRINRRIKVSKYILIEWIEGKSNNMFNLQ
jgi:hypothetical protein